MRCAAARAAEKPHHAGTAAGFDECHLVEPADFVFHADAAVELDQVGANAKQYVLAVIDDFAGAGMFVGGSAPTEVRTALEESDAKTRVGECARRGEAGEAASGYGYGRLCGVLAHAGFWQQILVTLH